MKVVHELEPADERLNEEIAADEQEVNEQTAATSSRAGRGGLEVGIVLASVSILARRRWLLGAAGVAASAGVVLIVVGLLV